MAETAMTDLQIQERTRDKRRAELSEMALSTDMSGLMVPTNDRDLMDKANTMAQSGLMIKDIFRNNPGACAGLILLCAPYRINPFQASWKCYNVKADAPLAFEAQLIIAMINTAAPIVGRLNYTFEGKGPDRVCIVTGTDRDSGQVLEYRSPRKADITPQNSPLWRSDLDQQLCYYSARAFARRHYPEILLGVYDREEVESLPAVRDVTPQARAIASSNSILDALPEDEAEAVSKKSKPEPETVTDQMVQDLFDDKTPLSDGAVRNRLENLRTALVADLADTIEVAAVTDYYSTEIEEMRTVAPDLHDEVQAAIVAANGRLSA